MIAETKKLLAILAHPDDESMGMGGTLAKYAAEGIATYLVTATRGEKGWFGAEAEYPGAQALGEIRAAELDKAAEILGLQQVSFLDAIDGELDLAVPEEIIANLVHHIRDIRPQVVVTFDPSGYYGHPDHIAIAQFTQAALVTAADPFYISSGLDPAHRVDKLYYLAATAGTQAAYQAAFGDLVMNVDGVERRAVAWPAWAVTTRIDASAYWQQAWQAIASHRSQLPGYQKMLDLPEAYHRSLWGAQTFYRAYSLVNGGRAIESDLFMGVEEPVYA